MKGYLYKELKQNRLFLFLTFLAAGCAAFLPIILVMISEETMAKEAFLVFARDGILLRILCITLSFFASLAIQGLVFKGDDIKKWGYFVASNPKGIKGYIFTKYGLVGAMCVIMLASSVGFDCIFTLIANVIGGISVPYMAKIFLLLFFFQLLFNAIELTFTIRFGIKRGSIIKTIFLIVIFIVLVLILLFNPAGLAETISEAFMEGEIPPFMKWVFPAISVILYILSAMFSCKLYMKGVDEYYQ